MFNASSAFCMVVKVLVVSMEEQRKEYLMLVLKGKPSFVLNKAIKMKGES